MTETPNFTIVAEPRVEVSFFTADGRVGYTGKAGMATIAGITRVAFYADDWRKLRALKGATGRVGDRPFLVIEADKSPVTRGMVALVVEPVPEAPAAD